MADSLQVSPAGNKATIVVISLNKEYIHVSKDYGKIWGRYNTPTNRFDTSSDLYLSNFDPQHMVIRGVMGEVRGVGDRCAWVNDAASYECCSCGCRLTRAGIGTSSREMCN